MKKTLFALALAAGCSSEPEQGGGNQAVPAAPASQPKAAPGRIATLRGLYEGGDAQRPHQMCVVEGKGGDQRFGLVVWGEGLQNCSGSGTVSRSGDRLRLAMGGDSACAIEATISGTTVRFPAAVPSGCAYYCGPRATLGGAELTQKGTAEADAMRARDLVGDPLCGGEGG
jgi:hypothetical protein